MEEKIEQPDGPNPHDLVEKEIARLKKKKESAQWFGLVGIALLFAAGISTAFMFGGVAMVLYGSSNYIYSSIRLGRLDDAWEDDEITEWEDRILAGEEMLDGEPTPPEELTRLIMEDAKKDADAKKEEE